jgi:hypothetical protein
MDNTKYIGMDVHQATISIAVLNSSGKLVMESVIETKAITIVQFVRGLRGDLHVTWEEGTWAAWLYDLLKPHVREVLVCDTRKNALLKTGNKSDRIDARKLAELLRGGQLQPAKRQVSLRGLNRDHNHELKNIFKGAAIIAATKAGPFQEFYAALVAKGIRPEMARLTLARKIAAIALLVWKKGVSFDAQHLKSQTA